jgi:DNA ligase-1
MLINELARVSAAVAATSGRLQKIELLADVLRRLEPREIPIAVSYLSGFLPQGTIGIGWASLRRLPPAAAPPATLGIVDVDEIFTKLKQSIGRGSQAVRRGLLHDLFARTTERERRFLIGLLSGELRQGALEGVMVEAVARAAGLPSADVRRALMVAGDLGAVAAAGMSHGAKGLARFRLQLLRPLQPMLAQAAADVADAVGRIRPAAVEWKLDGARIQVHRLGDVVRVFTRNLADVSAQVPEIVESVMQFQADAVVLDGEAIALGRDDRPHPFQVTMSRFSSRLGVEEHRSSVPLKAFFFDCLHLNGDDLIDRSGADRFSALTSAAPESFCIPREICREEDEARRILEAALAKGHEGVMVKSLDAPYEAGRRGASWLKVKRAHTLDLVVLAAEWGHGRRQGWLSNLHLGARDPETGGFAMLGKTFKGMTDKMLAWQTEHLLSLETHRDDYTVYVRPELVVEVAFDGIQSSSRYPSGLALRFARIKGYRPDKRVAETDTIQTVRALHTAR